jgi:hypothetical protein
MAALICPVHGVVVLEQDKTCWICAESGVRARCEPLEVNGTPITGELDENGEYRVHCVKLRLCEGCLLGIGEMCSTPGCAMWLHNSPFMPIHPELYEVVRYEAPAEKELEP